MLKKHTVFFLKGPVQRPVSLLVMQRMNSNAFFAAFVRLDFAVKGYGQLE